MTYEESIPIARKLAENQLKKGFDVEAFLILSQLNTLPDLPDTTIDNQLTDIGKMFVDYYNDPDLPNLEILLISLHKVIAELYQTCQTSDQQDLFRKHLNNLKF